MYIFFRLEKPVQCLKLHKVKPSVIFGFGGKKHKYFLAGKIWAGLPLHKAFWNGWKGVFALQAWKITSVLEARKIWAGLPLHKAFWNGWKGVFALQAWKNHKCFWGKFGQERASNSWVCKLFPEPVKKFAGPPCISGGEWPANDPDPPMNRCFGFLADHFTPNT